MQTKLELIKEKLEGNFSDVKIRSLGRVIRFNVEQLTDEQVLALATFSVSHCCGIKVKRSGTGLLIVVNT